MRGSCTWALPPTCRLDSRVGFNKGVEAWIVVGLWFPLSRITGFCIPYCICDNDLMLWIIQGSSRLLGWLFNLVFCFAFKHIHFQICGFQMATTVISLRHNSIKESLMTLHIFWFIWRNSLSRIITFSGVSSWVCKLGMCFLWVLNIFHARVNILGLLFEYLVKQTQKRGEKLISIKMEMNVTRNFQVFGQQWLLHILCFCLSNWSYFKHSHLSSWIHYWTNYQEPRDMAFIKFNKPLRTAERIHLSLKISLFKWKLNRNSDQILVCRCIVKASCLVFCNRN